MKLKQFNIISMIFMLSLFAISGDSKITGMAKQADEKNEALRRMGSYVQGCSDCGYVRRDCGCKKKKCTECECKGFPKTGLYRVALTSPSTGRTLYLRKLAFNYNIGAISGRAKWYPQGWPQTDVNEEISGDGAFHDCEHAHFKVVNCNRVDWECSVWGTGVKEISKMIATCTYKIPDLTAGNEGQWLPFTELFIGRMSPDGY